MDRVLLLLLLLLPSTSVPTLPQFKLFLCSSLVAAADNDDYVDEYDLEPAVSLFVAFRNRFGPFQLVT